LVLFDIRVLRNWVAFRDYYFFSNTPIYVPHTSQKNCIFWKFTLGTYFVFSNWYNFRML